MKTTPCACMVINENKENYFSLLCELRRVSELRVAFCIVPEKIWNM